MHDEYCLPNKMMGEAKGKKGPFSVTEKASIGSNAKAFHLNVPKVFK